jgi:putative lipoprotein
MNEKITTVILACCAGLLTAGCAPAHLEGSLNGSEWVVQRLNNQSALPDPQLTLAFSSEGKISGSAGCNPYAGEYAYTAASRTITVSSISKRLKTCVPSEVMEQEKEFLQALQDAASYITKCGKMTLFAADGRETAVLVKD